MNSAEHHDRSMPRVVITVSDQQSQPYRFQLDREKVTIGRSRNCDIVIDCPSVSGLHCTMERVPGGYILRDQDSTNGLKLKEEKMAVIDLRNDLEVFVGDVEFGYTLSDEELDELDEEDFVPHAKKASKKDTSSRSKPTIDRNEEEAPARKPGKAMALKTPARPVASAAPAPSLPSAHTGGSGFFGMVTLICGLGAFYAGLDASYRGKQEELGRNDKVSLFGDIKNGAPPLPEADEDTE